MKSLEILGYEKEIGQIIIYFFVIKTSQIWLTTINYVDSETSLKLEKLVNNSQLKKQVDKSKVSRVSFVKYKFFTWINVVK